MPDASPGSDPSAHSPREVPLPADALLPLVHDELHRLAQRALRGRGAGHTLQTTALMNEAWLRLGKTPRAAFRGREHFLAVAARAMRSILVDHARRRGAVKRGGGHGRIDLDEIVDQLEQSSTDLLALDEALHELAEADEQLARVVELRFFAGMNHNEIAGASGVSARTIERQWSLARAWLHARLASEEE